MVDDDAQRAAVGHEAEAAKGLFVEHLAAIALACAPTLAVVRTMRRRCPLLTRSRLAAKAWRLPWHT